ncbi:hypothetical protein FGO68_gene3064 [Halteria grandinella]|uniref:Uncharacterized protein n=1 Tax=Halteria grandinella TaxID=5974 RepID=A0A8J8NZ24_HALGN|nr:hypothetical protein FGO68_gene3064 [Halteria grandinella]
MITQNIKGRLVQRQQQSGEEEIQPSTIHALQLAKKIINISNSLAIIFMQSSLLEVAYQYLSKSSKIDICFYELPIFLHQKVLKWRGRILHQNLLAYFFYQLKDYGNALKYTFEAQSLAVELDESKNRDCDYIVAVNFVTFLILWKIGKHDEAKRYVDINRKLIDVLLDEDNQRQTSGSSQLSIIMEQSHQTLNNARQGGGAVVMHESFETEENYSVMENIEEMPKKASHSIDKRTLQKLLESDSEEEETGFILGQKVSKSKFSRLSQLSKLNLLGLVDLSLIACELKLKKPLDDAIRECEDSILVLKELNKDSTQEIGIASQNLIEELLENLLQLKDSERDNLDETTADNTKSNNLSVISSPNGALDKDHQYYLSQIRKGNKITQSKEFQLVFFITCFVPFIRPNLPMIKPQDLTKLKLTQKEQLKKNKRAVPNGKQEPQLNIDVSQLEVHRRLKEGLESSDGKVSVLIKLFEEEYAQKVRHDLAFQNSFMIDKYAPPPLQQVISKRVMVPQQQKVQYQLNRVKNGVANGRKASQNGRVLNPVLNPRRLGQGSEQVNSTMPQSQLGIIDINSGDGSPNHLIATDSQSEEAVNDDTAPVFTDPPQQQTGENSAISKANQVFEIGEPTQAKAKSVENYGAKKVQQLPQINGKLNNSRYGQENNGIKRSYSNKPLATNVQDYVPKQKQIDKLILNKQPALIPQLSGANNQRAAIVMYQQSIQRNKLASLQKSGEPTKTTTLLKDNPTLLNTSERLIHLNDSLHPDSSHIKINQDYLDTSSEGQITNLGKAMHQPPLSSTNTSSYHSAKASNHNPPQAYLTPYIKPQAVKNQNMGSDYAQKLLQKFDLYKYQKSGMTRLNVEQMAQQRGVQLQGVQENSSLSGQLEMKNLTTAQLAKMNINIEKLEAQISKNNKRFKVINHQANDFMSQKRQSVATTQRKPNLRVTPMLGAYPNVVLNKGSNDDARDIQSAGVEGTKGLGDSNKKESQL